MKHTPIELAEIMRGKSIDSYDGGDAALFDSVAEQLECLARIYAELEAKAAPVGEREAAIEAAYAAVVDGGWSSVKGMGVSMFQAGAAYQRKSDWQASGADCDSNILRNPDAKAWADFFVAVFPGQADKHGLMLGWFANAMMAMHDFLKAQQRRSGVVMPQYQPQCEDTALDEWERGWNACLREFARLNGGSHE